ncbi:MAG: hypothetical protein M3394_03405 [Actinomycetota bacterium]|nr:hypothetical protein [Actinomycetota bacterium]
MAFVPMAPAHAAPPDTPELVAPPPGHVFSLADPQAFRVRTGDPDGERWAGIIEVTNLDTERVTVVPTLPAESGQETAAVAAPPLGPGRYQWRAQATDSTNNTSLWSESRSFEVGPNHAPSAPVLLSPTDGATLRRNGNEFSISVLDIDGDIVVGTVVVLRNGVEAARIATAPPTSGVQSGVLPTTLSEGSYTWYAEAVDVHGARSERSPAASFQVGPPPTGGGGAVVGSVTYDSPGLPPGTCEPLTSSISLTSALAVVNSAIVGYAGPADLAGTTTSSCESVPFAFGRLVLDITDTGATESSLTCHDLAGPYTRVGSTLVVTLSGGCKVNDFSISQVAVVATVELVPDVLPTDVPWRIRHAAAGGSFVVRPQ